MLKKQYDEKLAQKEELRKKSEEMELKLERAGMLVSGLAGEKARWEETVKVRSVVPPGSPSSLPTSSNLLFRLGIVRENGDTQDVGTSKNGGWEFFSPSSHLVRSMKGKTFLYH